jgi:GT2 family glycosyltransferase
VSDGVSVSVIIPTHNRLNDLRRCLTALKEQQTDDIEIIVVDDGSLPPVADALADTDQPLQVLRLDGVGPAAARNAGAATATGEILLFTDDDTIPAAGWIDAARDELFVHQEAVAVEGMIVSRPYDPLFEYSIAAAAGGHYWTANIAYRRNAFQKLGGFADDAFPYPHCEDRDLGLRAAKLGEVRFRGDMVVEHVPRAMSLGDFGRRGRYAASEIRLIERHPELGRESLARYLSPIRGAIGYWRVARRQTGIEWTTGRRARLACAAAMHLYSTTVACARELVGRDRRSAP